MGNLNATGLGAFLNAGTDPVYDPLLVQGLQITEQAITHVADGWRARHTEPLSFSSPQNAELWADWVRASLYITDFARDLDWNVCTADDNGKQSITLGYRTRGAHHGDPVPFYRVFRPDIETFEAQLKFMRNYLDQRPDRTAEIVSQLGFPTPYFMMILGLQASPNRYTLELIGITQVLAAHTAMVVKHHLACRRPDKLGAKVMPFIPTPAHASFPSAHSTEAFAVAELLKGLIYNVDHYADLRKRRLLLNKVAERIAVNRTVAGLHYPIDTWAGAVLGRTIGQIVLAKCGAPRSRISTYEYSAKGNLDFFLDAFVADDLYEKLDQRSANAYGDGIRDKPEGSPETSESGQEEGPATTCEAPKSLPDYGVKPAGHHLHVHPSGIFNWLWEKARKEFDLTRGGTP